MDLIDLSHPNEDELEGFVLQAEAGQYVSPNLDLPDWGVNDVNIWLVAPMAKPGCVCITNENTDFSSDDGGEPQQFTLKNAVGSTLKRLKPSTGVGL